MTDDEFFAMRDKYLAEHTDVVRAMQWCTWYDWAMRRMRPVRLIEQIWRDGKLVSERDVTPADPEPPLDK
ncbi:MAG TPA: hypothetical protein VJO13_09070 [Ktedonobacterales bacterium]|nr:hypothetical protein [Ktedonobacterales bacterium]